MAKGQHYSAYQRKIIDRYYEHQDTIIVTRLGEMVSDLYLADTESKQQKIWKRVEQALAKSGLEPKRYEAVVAKRDVQGLAALVGQLAVPPKDAKKK